MAGCAAGGSAGGPAAAGGEAGRPAGGGNLFMTGCLGGLVPKGPRREPPAPKRSRRTGSAAGAGVFRNAPGTGRMGVMAAMLCDVRAWALGRAARHSGPLLACVSDGLEALRGLTGWRERQAGEGWQRQQVKGQKKQQPARCRGGNR